MTVFLFLIDNNLCYDCGEKDDQRNNPENIHFIHNDSSKIDDLSKTIFMPEYAAGAMPPGRRTKKNVNGHDEMI